MLSQYILREMLSCFNGRCQEYFTISFLVQLPVAIVKVLWCCLGEHVLKTEKMCPQIPQSRLRKTVLDIAGLQVVTVTQLYQM